MGDSNLLFESVFKRDLSSDGTREYLSQITKEHPYFTPAQFFLLKLTPKESPGYVEQVAKTSLLFNNPYWLQFQLQETVPGTAEINDPVELKEHKFSLPGEENNISPALESVNAADNPEEIITSTAPISIDPGINPVQNEPFINEEIASLQAISNDEQQSFSAGTVKPETPEVNIIAGISPEPPIGETRDMVNEINEIKPQETEADLVINNNKETDTLISDDSQLAKSGHVDEIANTSLPPQFMNQGEPLVNESETQEDIIPEQETEPLQFKLNIDVSEVKEDTITFEPLHTTDYFASQGIKLSGEILPTDKLGKQLKSFTEWLKTMKKVHADQMPATSGQSDLSIQKLAEKSNIEEGIITEAMADVLLQQGKADKAIEVYKKLSLLNPSKSAYFAAKIDQLKEH